MKGWPAHLRWIGPLVVFLIGSVVVLAIVSESQSARRYVERDHARLRAELERRYDLAANIDAYREQLALLESAFSRASRQLPAEIIDPIVWATSAAERTGIAIIAVDSGPVQSFDFYASADARVRLEGTFGQFLAFVDALSNTAPGCSAGEADCTGPLHSITEVELDQRSADLLRIDLRLRLYRYVDEEETG